MHHPALWSQDGRGGTFPTKAEARRTIFEYTEAFYNTTRLHSSLGYLSPNTSTDNRYS